MGNEQLGQKCKLGIVGLGVMGRNLLLNMAEHGYNVAGYDKDIEKVETLRGETEFRDIASANNVKEFIDLLSTPRAVLMLVPAGAPVDAVINDLLPYLEKGDLIIDAGNSYFKDTDVREKKLAEKGIHFLGVGVSGGEEGARHGPSMMPGGPLEAYEVVRPLFEAAAAKVQGEPCVAYMGKGAAGHFVKMVHNGIEYGIMQLIAETYDLMKQGLGFSDDQLHQVYSQWNKSELNSYLIEITSKIFLKVDKQTGNRLIGEILDVARQKGTGMWTSQSGMELQVPLPTIDVAVTMRNLSMLEEMRKEGSEILKTPKKQYVGDTVSFTNKIENALYAAMIITYAQGLSLLSIASDKEDYQLNLEAIARIWRGGCIIRAELLEDIREAYKRNPKLINLLLDPALSKKILSKESDLRQVICSSVELGVPIPGLMTSLAYLDSCRNAWLPANLIQAQRDYFGAHTFEKVNEKGTFHTEWDKE